MKFRMRKRKRASAHQAASIQRPPQVITVNAADSAYEEEDLNERRSALQKLFASHLFKISRKHLGDNRDNTNWRRTSLADVSTTAGDTSVLRPDDQFFLAEERIKPKPAPSFRITCGTNNSILAPRRREGRAGGGERHCLPRPAPLTLKCTDKPPEETSKALAPPCSFWCLSVVPDSYNDVDNEGIMGLPPQKHGTLFYHLGNLLKKKPETKRNGIPKVITVVPGDPDGRHVDTSCCGAMSLMDNDLVEDIGLGRISSHRRDNTQTSFDTSLVRLEESLMRANLEADVEEKFTAPMLEPRPLAQSRTATSATSSISTHSSIKFGASIVPKRPAKAASPTQNKHETPMAV